MQIQRQVTAFYPSFGLGDEPRAVECTLAIVEANGRRYLKTPFAMLDLYSEGDPERQFGRGYYATQAECQAYLDAEYPRWKTATPIMDALCRARHQSGELVGNYRIADKLGVTLEELFKLARGHKSCFKVATRAKVFA